MAFLFLSFRYGRRSSSGGAAPSATAILLEDGTAVLLENGTEILLE